ncbi:MAG: hypothetical protein ACP5QC_01325 [Caldimicrobium sp.]|jgi:DNA-binding IclR family transcriptional regulator
MKQGCVSPDGKPSERAMKLLQLIHEKKGLTPEEVASLTGRPLFQVRSSLRELYEAGFLEEKEGKYFLTEKAQEFLKV